jgi:hypothetical protein
MSRRSIRLAGAAMNNHVSFWFVNFPSQFSFFFHLTECCCCYLGSLNFMALSEALKLNLNQSETQPDSSLSPFIVDGTFSHSVQLINECFSSIAALELCRHFSLCHDFVPHVLTSSRTFLVKTITKRSFWSRSYINVKNGCR